MTEGFRLLMLGAMYENGGNATHRHLDGHPQMFVYPFESQLGTALVNDALSGMFPAKYRWPEFRLDADPREDYLSIIDEECKVRARTPRVSKFRHVPFEMDDGERREAFARIVGAGGRSRPAIVAAFFRATFEAWRDRRVSGRESVYVGYSPVLVVDADKILTELPDAHFLHVVRNPWSAYADTKKRPVPLALARYMLGWTVNQQHALLFKERFPKRLHIVRAEDVFRDPVGTLGAVCSALDLEAGGSLAAPTFNGAPLPEVYPWGTIRRATPEANLATARELAPEETDAVTAWAGGYLETFDYKGFLRG
ncbi:MAG TPA: sulfotransferase [Thermoanaerobaculaceae bacterium]|nr:sulfotransferase [Thermoanaerobaculaceae bacterium]